MKEIWIVLTYVGIHLCSIAVPLNLIACLTSCIFYIVLLDLKTLCIRDILRLIPRVIFSRWDNNNTTALSTLLE